MNKQTWINFLSSQARVVHEQLGLDTSLFENTTPPVQKSSLLSECANLTLVFFMEIWNLTWLLDLHMSDNAFMIYQMYKIINAYKIHPFVSHVETRKSLTSQVLSKNLSNATDFKMTWYCNLPWRFLHQHWKPVQSAKVLILSKSAEVQSIYTVTLKQFNEIMPVMDIQLRFSILAVVYVTTYDKAVVTSSILHTWYFP